MQGLDSRRGAHLAHIGRAFFPTPCLLLTLSAFFSSFVGRAPPTPSSSRSLSTAPTRWSASRTPSAERTSLAPAEGRPVGTARPLLLEELLERMEDPRWRCALFREPLAFFCVAAPRQSADTRVHALHPTHSHRCAWSTRSSRPSSTTSPPRRRPRCPASSRPISTTSS